ncbi:hypothetical protein C5167_001287 [Papaver somniferum]|uniref:PUM-HD domain-containing protein n=1 Tax=Papaver somniferum TaxID=3469 RepID=A0A4Y7KVG4_PAPSO|nr:pumilio homolog 2-like isoform X1 [Papaver somniferum]RZC75895.1 hypothetical protein C5167_001287 [Papaver somniferum]
MVTENPLNMLSDMGMRNMLSDGSYNEELGKELEILLREQRRKDNQAMIMNDRERELSMFRSGSAPPTVEGSLAAVGGLFNGGGVSMNDFNAVIRNGGGGGGNGFRSEEELRSDPEYLSYYYSNVNLNPRLPPPMLSKEDWRFQQRYQSGGGGAGGGSGLGGIGDRRKVQQQQHRAVDDGGSRSLFSSQPGYSIDENDVVESRKGQTEWSGADGLIGFSGLGLGGKQKSFADIFQDDVGRASPVSAHPSRPASRTAFDDGVDTLGSAESQLAQLHHELLSSDALRSGANVQGISGVQNNGASAASHSYASALGASLSRSTTPTPDPQHIARAPSPGLPPVGAGKHSAKDNRSLNSSNSFTGVSSGMNNSADLAAALSGMSLSNNGAVNDENHMRSQIQQEIEDHQHFLFNLQNGQSQAKQQSYLKRSGSGNFHGQTKDSYPDYGKSNGLGNTHSMKVPPPPINTGSGGFSPYQNVDNVNPAFANYGLSGYSGNLPLSPVMASQVGSVNLPHLFENFAAASAMGAPGMDSRGMGGGLGSPNFAGAADLQNLHRMGSNGVHPMDPLFLQYLRTAEYAAALNDPSLDRNYMGGSYADILSLQKAYLGALISPKSQYGLPYAGKSGGMNQGYYGNASYGLGGMSYPNSLINPILPNSPVGPGSPMRHSERNMRFASGMRNLGGNVTGSWHSEVGGNMDDSFSSSLLEEFKNNKTKSFELSEIAGHVVEFSADQYGSRFIQQKLETASEEEKNMVFQEIIPQGLALMTDVFGNYVIQKFFEHGTAPQRRELANQLNGHVLTLSLQMYGCRVIQKAIEVVDLDQQTKMVAELDGHIMRCVRDQNGNHVIQKCIECIPQDAIQFIISSFYDQVVTLSTHPYGCRVIQRVLEHCSDPKTQQIMMDEIFQSVCMLAQDQYGNYVVQHVLEHGKPHERTAIIKKLAGQIVQMSQQKFASNVVEKCLTFGGPVERQFLVSEMLGTTDENEPLQAMMKDQFANYVVQKVLETCDDQQRELILSRIKVHLNALKKYTYGKHIVARVEKLVAAGESYLLISERRIALSSSYNAAAAAQLVQ